MRALAVLALPAALAAAACSVPDKSPIGPDASTAPPDAMVDTTAPDTTITSAPPEFTQDEVATFEFTASEPDVTFTCAFDGEDPVTCTSPYSRTLGDGTHTFVVRASDAIGNSDDTPAEHVWTIDRTAPNTTITDRPPLADNSVTVQFGFTSDEDNVRFDCSVDGADFLQCASGDDVGPLADGPHTFAVRATDRAGNTDASAASYTWSIDTSTPDTELVSGPSGPTASSTATFTFISPDAGSGATFQCSLDAAAFANCTSPKTYSGLASGDHDFAVRVRDAVGNLDPTPATRSWTVDVTPPNTTIVTGPSGVVATASASFTFTSDESPVTYECSDDGGAYAGCTSPHTLTGLAQGAHTFAVRATDAAGHPDPSPAQRSWTVDTVAPDVSITAGPGAGTTTGPWVVFQFTASEGAVTCSVDGGAYAACASPFGKSLPNGDHDFAVRATDGAGNTGTATRSWTVACGPADPTSASGALHLDVPDQIQPNAVAGGADATLGDDNTVEPADPDPISGGRFGGALALTGSQDDHVAWPVALAATTTFALEVWARPDAPAGARDLVVNTDARIALRVTAASPTTVRFSATIVKSNGMARTTTSAPVAASVWHHVLASSDGMTLRLWIDGAGTSIDQAGFGSTQPSLASLRLGGAGAAAYTGDVDEVWFAVTPIANDDDARARYCPQ